MKLDLREEKRRDNTKGIKDVDKASTAELNRTIDTNSPAEGKAKVVIKRREEKAKAKSKDAETKDAETQDTADQDDDKKNAEEFAELQKD